LSAGDGRFRSGLVVGLVIGLVVATAVAVLIGVIDTSPLDDDPVVQAREVIEDHYFHDPDLAQLDDASIRGMVDELRRRYDDKFSHYFSPKQLESFEAATSGRFSGVGLTVTEVPKGLRVASVLPDTPAKRAGIEVGDLIVAVDGKSIQGVPSEVSTGRIKGPAGTEVELRIEPGEGGNPREITVERADVRVPAVVGDLRRVAGTPVAYVRFATFSEGAHGELRDTIERLERRGAEGLVLDLRGNGGGLLNEAVLSASVLVEDGNIVSTRSRTQGDRSYEAVGDALEPRPMAVLVNRDTASAAEILAAALEEYDLATVVGTRTYGKGTFQQVLHLPAGGALDLTEGEYLTADGTSILGTGVKPEVRVESKPSSSQDAALDRALQVVEHDVDGKP
jgi:carboxyl-terminal processing protease